MPFLSIEENTSFFQMTFLLFTFFCFSSSTVFSERLRFKPGPLKEESRSYVLVHLMIVYLPSCGHRFAPTVSRRERVRQQRRFPPIATMTTPTALKNSVQSLISECFSTFTLASGLRWEQRKSPNE